MGHLGSSDHMGQACLILTRLAHGSSWLEGWPEPGPLEWPLAHGWLITGQKVESAIYLSPG